MSQATSKLNNWKQKEVYFKQQYIPNFKTPMQIEHFTTICIVSHNHGLDCRQFQLSSCFHLHIATVVNGLS